MRRHKEPGEESVEQVFERLSWRLERGYWVKEDDAGTKRLFSAGVARQLWEEQGPRKLELLIREKGAN